MPTGERSGGEIVVESLRAFGVDRVFCVPGESYLGLLDALYGHPEIDTVVCRHEGGAGFMALADARLTGRPGIVCVSRGPGASNAAIAVHTAQQDGVPLMLVVGQVAAGDVRRDSFQEIDYGHMFGRIAKWTGEARHPDQVGEIMMRALQIATTGVPGPVVVALPEDVLTAATRRTTIGVPTPLLSAPAPAAIDTLRDWLSAAERPLILAGSGLDRPAGREALRAFAEAWRVPVLVSFRRQDLFPNQHPLYAGDMGLSNPADQMAALRDADLLLVAGARLSDITTQGYTWPDLLRPRARLAHIHADPQAVGGQFAADLGLICEAKDALNALGSPVKTAPASREAWRERLAAIRADIARPKPKVADDGIHFEQAVATLAAELSDDAIVTLDAGTFGAPVYRIVPFRPPQRLLAPISGAMGFGIPAAVAAGLREPSRPVICLVGDGGFLMTGGELAVALERDLPLKVILSENGSYASIRIHQERDYPGRTIGTSFTNPDFEAMGRAYRCEVSRLRTPADLAGLGEILRRPGRQFIVVDTSLSAVLGMKQTEKVVAE